MRLKGFAFFLCITAVFTQCRTKPETTRPVELVYPLLDTENSRWFYFSSACRPFGMVQLSPDTELDGAWSSGYQYDIDTIKGFSHIHGWQISGISVMPVCIEPGSGDFLTDHFSEFSHENEIVQVGYHMLELDRYGIKAELTSTHRVGFHRYDFPGKEEAAIVFRQEGQLGPSRIKDGAIQQLDDYTISGYMINAPTIRRPRDFKVFFVARFNHEIKEITGSRDKTGSRGSRNQSVHFGNSLDSPLKMKLAISYTSKENAMLNLETELDHWDFEKVVEESREEWDELLGRISVKGGSEVDRRRFYTDLWHALQGRRTLNDVNGAYPDYTGASFRIGQLPLNEEGKPRHRYFNSDSFWGVRWSLNILWGLAYPDIYEEHVNSLLTYYVNGGLIPRGPSGGNYTHVMTGSSMTSFIIGAYQKGIRGFDAELGYEGLKKNHMPGGMMGHCGYEHYSAKGGGIEPYINLGYVPYPISNRQYGFHMDGAGQTLEYAFQDWALAQFSLALEKEEDYSYFMKRSQNYRNLWDPGTGWIRPRNWEGEWKDPFDPFEYKAGFVEANAAQFTWSVPHDIEGLAELMGGKQIAAERLNKQFEQAEKLGFTSGTSHEVELHPEYRRVPINYGNQPSMQTAFIFNFLDRPDLTQYWSRRILEEVYSHLSPQRGYNGDEDQGLMGALSASLKIGLFQMRGGADENPTYELGSPVFDEVLIRLHPDFYPGKAFTVRTLGNGPGKYYISKAMLNGSPLDGFSINHEDIINGGELLLEMSESLPAE